MPAQRASRARKDPRGWPSRAIAAIGSEHPPPDVVLKDTGWKRRCGQGKDVYVAIRWRAILTTDGERPAQQELPEQRPETSPGSSFDVGRAPDCDERNVVLLIALCDYIVGVHHHIDVVTFRAGRNPFVR